jgi:hypothetical protein
MGIRRQGDRIRSYKVRHLERLPETALLEPGANGRGLARTVKTCIFCAPPTHTFAQVSEAEQGISRFCAFRARDAILTKRQCRGT